MKQLITETSRAAIQAAVKACHKRKTLKCWENGFRYDEDRQCMQECECRVKTIVKDALSHFECHRPRSLGESRIHKKKAIESGAWFFSGNQGEWKRDVYNVIAKHVREGQSYEYTTADDIILAEFKEGRFAAPDVADKATISWYETELLVIYLYTRPLFKDRGPTHIHALSQARRMNGKPTWVFYDGDQSSLTGKFGEEFAGMILEKGEWHLEKFE